MATQNITTIIMAQLESSTVPPREQQREQHPLDSSDDEADMTRFRHLDASSKSIASMSNSNSNSNSNSMSGSTNTNSKAKTTTAFSHTAGKEAHTESQTSGNHTRDKHHDRDEQISPSKSKSKAIPSTIKRNDSQTMQSRKPRNAVPKKRRPIIAKKTIMERKWPKKRKLPLSSTKKIKKVEGSLVQYMEKLHYGKTGKYKSFSVIPNLFVTKMNSKTKRKFIHASQSKYCAQYRSTTTEKLALSKGTKIDDWVTQVGIPHLKELGWAHDATLNEFNLITNGTFVRLSRKRLVDIVSGSKERLTMDSTPEVVDQFAYRLEEEILMDAAQRVIDLDAMVQSSSCSLDSPDVMMASVDVSRVSADDAIASSSEGNDDDDDEDNGMAQSPSFYDQDLFSEGNESVDTPMEAPGSGSGSAKSKGHCTKLPRTSVSKPSSHKSFEKCKCFPKYIGASNELMFTEELLKKIPTCKISMIDSSEDDETVELHFRGAEAIIDEALSKIVEFAHKEIAVYNAKILLKDEQSIEIEIKMNAMDQLGFQTKTKKGDDCLWISEITEGGQLQSIIGAPAKKGVVITAMKLLEDGTWKAAKSNKEKKKLINRAKSSYTSSKDENSKWILLRILLAKDENIASMDVTHVVLRNGKSIRCRDGTTYRGKSRALFQDTVRSMAIVDSSGVMKSIPKRGIGSKIPSKKRKLSARAVRSIDDDGEVPAKKTKPSSPPSERTLINTDKGTSFHHFSMKMKEVKDIEFRYKKIHIQAANGSMWNQHKKLFGEHCDSKCSCVAQLKVLTSNAVTDCVSSKQKKVPTWQPSPDIYTPVGFADSFCPRFYGKVQTLFPNYSPEQVLSKLVDMWRNGHQIQRLFSAKCSSFCNCATAWETVFLPICKGEKASKAKVKKTASNVGATNIGRPKPTSFEIMFKPWKTSLGLFLETHGQDGKRVCAVTSVDPRDKYVFPRVSCGSTISSYQVGNSPAINVNSYNQVEVIFDTLMRATTSLTLKFIPPGNAKKVDCSGDWSVDTNAWIGNSRNPGWAGGAMHGHNNLRKSVNSTGPTKALGLTEKYLSKHAKAAIHKAQRTESIKSTPKVARQELLPRNPVTESIKYKYTPKVARQELLPRNPVHLHVPQEASIQRDTGSSRPLSSPDNEPGIESKAVNQPKQPAKFIVPAPKILRAKGSSASGAKVRIDLSKNDTIVFDWCQEEHKHPRLLVHRPCSQIAEQEKLIENVLGKKLAVLAPSLKHCTHVHELNYKGPVDEMKRRVIELEEEARLIDGEDITPREKEERKEEVKCHLRENDLKVKLLKVYAKIYTCLQIVGKTTPAELEKKEINIIDHIIKHQKGLGETLKKSLDNIEAFRKDALSEGRELDFDADIEVKGVSILHVATIIGDEKNMLELLRKGVQITRSSKLGTPLDLAKVMHREAQSKGNLDWAKKYLLTISLLENYVPPRR